MFSKDFLQTQLESEQVIIESNLKYFCPFLIHFASSNDELLCCCVSGNTKQQHFKGKQGVLLILQHVLTCLAKIRPQLSSFKRKADQL